MNNPLYILTTIYTLYILHTLHTLSEAKCLSMQGQQGIIVYGFFSRKLSLGYAGGLKTQLGFTRLPDRLLTSVVESLSVGFVLSRPGSGEPVSLN
jgi:hypothetical protein